MNKVENVTADRYWHYTSQLHLTQILSDGLLRTDRDTTPHAFLPSEGRLGAVWFSSNPWWEATSGKGGVWSMKENHHLFGLVRIGVRGTDVDLLPWRTYKKVGRIARNFARGMERIGREYGADPEQWFASLKPSPASIG